MLLENERGEGGKGHTCGVWCVFQLFKDILNVHKEMEALVA